MILTTTIEVIMGRRLLDEVVYRIRIRIEAGKAVLAIAEAVKVGKKAIYKMRSNRTLLLPLFLGDRELGFIKTS